MGNNIIILFVKFSEDKPVSQSLHGLSGLTCSCTSVSKKNMSFTPALHHSNFVGSRPGDMWPAVFKRMHGMKAISAKAPKLRSELVSLPSGKHTSHIGERLLIV